MKEGISVVISTIKNQYTVERAINSVLHQTLDQNRYEILVIVNGHCFEYAEKVKEKYEGMDNIRVIYEEQGSLKKSRYIGAINAQFDHLTYLDGDDYFMPGYLEKLYGEREEDVEIVCSSVLYLKNRVLYASDFSFFKEDVNHLGEKNGLSRKGEILAHAVMLWGKLYQTKTIVNGCTFNHFHINRGEDNIFWCENYENIGGRIKVLTFDKETSYVYDISSTSMSRPKVEEKREYGKYLEEVVIATICKYKEQNNISEEHRRFIDNRIDGIGFHAKNFLS